MTDVQIVCATPKSDVPAPKGAPEPKKPPSKSKQIVRKLSKIGGSAALLLATGGRKADKLPVPPPKVDTGIPAILDRTNGGLSKEQVNAELAKLNTKKAPVVRPALKAPASGKPVEAPKASGGVAGKAKPAKPASDRLQADRGLYDWDGALAKAKAGVVPPLPPYTSYQPHMAKVHAMAKKGDHKAISDFGKTFKDKLGGRVKLFRYIDLCLKALGNQK